MHAALPLILLLVFFLVVRGERASAQDDVETRAHLCLKNPESCFENFSQEDFEYDYHECHSWSSSLVCTACYKHPKRYLGQVSIECPNKPKAKCRLLLPADFKERRVDPAYCERPK